MVGALAFGGIGVMCAAASGGVLMSLPAVAAAALLGAAAVCAWQGIALAWHAPAALAPSVAAAPSPQSPSGAAGGRGPAAAGQSEMPAASRAAASPGLGRVPEHTGAASARRSRAEAVVAALSALGLARAPDEARATIVAYITASESPRIRALQALHDAASSLRGAEAEAFQQASGAAAAARPLIGLLPLPGKGPALSDDPADEGGAAAALVALQRRRLAPLEGALRRLAAADPTGRDRAGDAATAAVRTMQHLFGAPAEPFDVLYLTRARALAARAEAGVDPERAYRSAREAIAEFLAAGGNFLPHRDQDLATAAPEIFAQTTMNERDDTAAALYNLAGIADSRSRAAIVTVADTLGLTGLIGRDLGDRQRRQRLDGLLASYQGPHAEAYRGAVDGQWQRAQGGTADQCAAARSWLDTFTSYLAALVEDPVVLVRDQARIERAFAHVLGQTSAKTRLADVMHPYFSDVRSGLHEQPIALQGPSGEGKSTLARAVPRALGFADPERHLVMIDVSREHAAHALGGLGGEFAVPVLSPLVKAMIAAKSGHIVFVIDEADKATRDEVRAQVGGLLDSPSTMRDAYLGVPVDLTNVLVLGTTNDLSALQPHLQSRVGSVSIELAPLNQATQMQIVAGLLAGVAARLVDLKQRCGRPGPIAVEPCALEYLGELHRAARGDGATQGMRRVKTVTEELEARLHVNVEDGIDLTVIRAEDVLRLSSINTATEPYVMTCETDLNWYVYAPDVQPQVNRTGYYVTQSISPVCRVMRWPSAGRAVGSSWHRFASRGAYADVETAVAWLEGSDALTASDAHYLTASPLDSRPAQASRDCQIGQYRAAMTLRLAAPAGCDVRAPGGITWTTDTFFGKLQIRIDAGSIALHALPRAVAGEAEHRVLTALHPDLAGLPAEPGQLWLASIRAWDAQSGATLQAFPSQESDYAVEPARHRAWWCGPHEAAQRGIKPPEQRDATYRDAGSTWLVRLDIRGRPIPWSASTPLPKNALGEQAIDGLSEASLTRAQAVRRMAQVAASLAATRPGWRGTPRPFDDEALADLVDLAAARAQATSSPPTHGYVVAMLQEVMSQTPVALNTGALAAPVTRAQLRSVLGWLCPWPEPKRAPATHI